MGIKSQKDFFSGLLMMAVGVSFASGATHYKIGDAGQMGPGYFPLVVGVLLAVQGSGIALQSMARQPHEGDRLGKLAWKPLFYIIAANLVFGALLGGLPRLGIPPMGMVPAIVALTLIASLAQDTFHFKAVAVLAMVLSSVSYLVFVVLLKLPLAVWPAFIAA
jgi:hypothetical protein